MIVPRRMGRFLTADESGHIQPDVAGNLVGDNWKPLIAFIVDALRKRQEVRSIYIRGSIPRGLAIEHVSDADFIYFSEANFATADHELENAATTQFPFAKDVELFRLGHAQLDERFHSKQRPHFHMLLKTQSLFLAGKDIARQIRPFKIGPEMASHVFLLEREFSMLPGLLKTARRHGDERPVRQWFSRRIVRAGLEITMDRSQRFTRDLYLCYEDFAKFYPERSGQMYRVLTNCLNGEDSPLQYDRLVRFLVNESTRLFALQFCDIL